MYLLHGYTDDETGWTQFGEVEKLVAELQMDSDVTDMVIAMPNAGVSWYVNSFDGSYRYEDFFIQEFIPHIEETYRGRSERRYRAIAGLSMGGRGTLLYTLKYPELFSAAAPLSSSIWLEAKIGDYTLSRFNSWYGEAFGRVESGTVTFTEHMEANHILSLIEEANPAAFNRMRFYIDCGDDDHLVEENIELSKALSAKGIAHEFRVRDGGHSWSYWREALPEVLRFVSAGFHQQ